MRMVCVYCGSSPGSSPVYADAARRLGETLVERGLGLVYGGAHVGLMGVLADAVLGAGGEAIGVIPASLRDREIAHTGLTELHVVDTMHERKHLMAETADAFIALPGGLGTLEELFEALTWLQLGLHSKPIGLLDVDGYWQPLRDFLTHAADAGFVARKQVDALILEHDPASLLDAFADWLPPSSAKWSATQASIEDMSP